MDILLDTYNGRALVATTVVKPDNHPEHSRTRVYWLGRSKYGTAIEEQYQVVDLPFNAFLRAAEKAVAAGKIPDFTYKGVDDIRKAAAEMTKPRLRAPAHDPVTHGTRHRWNAEM